MRREKFLHMAKKTNGPVLFGTLLILLLSLPGVSCAKLNPLKKEAAPSPLSNADLAADSALGTLPKKGGAVQQVEAEATADEMLGELHRKEKEEEEKRLQHAVAEDRILEEQIRRQ